MTGSKVLSVLVVHPEAETRRALVETLRLALPGAALHTSEASTPTQALQVASWLDPKVVLLDLIAERRLALDVARTLRRPGRWILGLYNPLIAADRGAELFRAGARAGVTDYVALPASEAELAAALSALESSASESRRDGRVLAFIAAQGGAGSTTLALNTALVLAGSRAAGGVVLCDANLQFGNAAAHLGLAPDRDLIDLLRDLDAATTLTPYLLHHTETGLDLLASPGDAADAEAVAPEDLSRALVALRRRFETLIVDLPAAVDLRTLAALDLADRIYVVTEAIAPTVVSTQRLLALLDELGLADRVRVVVNRYSSFEGNLSEGVVAQRLGRPVDRVVPYDRAVVVAANRGAPLVLAQRRGAFAEAIGELAGEAVESRSGGAAPLRR
ncbi:MAG TPA: AAA family ATPase [Thermoanaerobaculia bacterium]|nr:AAA family ATPase [Thermoanaerobaculia bacterium]